MMPRSLIESASSSRSASEKLRLGLRGLGARNAIGTRRWLRPRSTAFVSSPTSPISAANPRPSRDRPSSAILFLSRLCRGGFQTRPYNGRTALLLALIRFDLGGRVSNPPLQLGAQFLFALDD